MSRRTVFVALLIGAFGLSLTMAAMAADTKPVRIAGKITKIEGKSVTIADTVVTCNDASKIKRDGQSAPGTFADLAVGQEVRAYCTPGDNIVLNLFIAK
jgi:hypothetical protein